MNSLETLYLKLHSLVIFKKLLQDRVVKKFSDLLAADIENLTQQVKAYSSFVYELFNENIDWTEYLLNLIINDDNIYVNMKAKKLSIDPMIEQNIIAELKILEEISRIKSREIKKYIGYEGYMPEWKNASIDIERAYRNHLDQIEKTGYGIFAKYHMFRVENQQLAPVHIPDPIKISDLKGYEDERNSIIKNTLALLDGKPAANVLLYGDAGTGKSSTVKAIVNQYKDHGLRLIEFSRNQLSEIPSVIGDLHHNPLKFIIFIDDLSFSKVNEDFNTLKAILEGSAAARPENLAIYATSNRRHLVKESFSERQGDDVHINETIQEVVSLSERFGLSVYFFKPDKEQYLKIVHELAKEHGIKADNDQLNVMAEQYAMRRGGRSPRVARQFIENLKNMG